MKDFLSTLLLSAVIISAFGCASQPPSFGDRVMAEGESRIAIAEQWERGKRESKQGEKQVRKGRKLVERGRAELRKGEQLIASGNIAVQVNRQAYQGLSQTAQPTQSAELAAERVAQLRNYAKAWEDGEAEIVTGRKMIERGGSRIEEGESLIRKGEALLESGRAKMQNAERKYQPAG